LHFFLFVFFFVTSVFGENPCDVPPALWCDDPVIASQCGATASCANFNNTMYGKHLKITLLYETLCPYCQDFMTTVLYPQVFRFGQDFVDIELIPYGNANMFKRRNGTVEFVCQHGPEECVGNKLHSCIINQLKNVKTYFPLIYCMESDLKANVNMTEAVDECFKKEKISQDDQDQINQCYNGDLGVQLQIEAANKTAAVQPQQHTGVPWILVNDVSTSNLQAYQDALFSVLCAWYQGPSAPRFC
jgi:interferon gamma-inducible protein 30